MTKFPTAFTILLALIIVVAALTWIVPAGQYERAFNDTLGREAPALGAYAEVEPNPRRSTTIGTAKPSAWLGSTAGYATVVAANRGERHKCLDQHISVYVT
jgi:uncharacterized ion transporter superfamily protein YfcC